MRIFAYLFVYFSFLNTASAEFDLNSNMSNAYSYCIDLNFSKAKYFLEMEKNINPENGFIYLNENYIDFLKIIITEDQSYFEKQKPFKNERLKKIRRNDKDSPFYLFSQAEIYIQWAFVRIKFKEYFLAAYELQKAYSLLKKNDELFPDFILNKKNIGVLKILLGSIPDEYNWILSVIGLEGSINRGFDDLYSVLNYTENFEKYNIYEDEVIFYLSFLEMNMRNIKQSRLSLLNKIEDCCLSSDLLVFCAARLSNKMGDNQRTLKILEEVKPSNNKINFYYLDYLYAMSKLYQLNFEEAENSFLRFVSNFKGDNYIKSAYHKLSIISFLTDSIDKRDFYQNKTLELGQSFIEEDKYSENQVKNRYIDDKDLIMARFLFDGGYYQRSLNILESINQPALKDYNLAEYYYRIARLYQKLNYSKNDILDAFYQLLDLENSYNLYYFPMSNLQIALEYEKEENDKAALMYFQKTLKYDAFDYETGIKKSAKAGLNRIRNN